MASRGSVVHLLAVVVLILGCGACASTPASAPATSDSYQGADAPYPSVQSGSSASPAADDGAPSQKTMSADEVARSLANPNTPLATLKLESQFRWFQGDLPGAEDESSLTLLFQPTFPFPLDGADGDVIFWRPAVPLLISQPVPVGLGDYDQQTELGDIGMDLGYGQTSKSGVLTSVGMVFTFPTGTSSATTTGRWSAGPEVLLAKFEKWGVYGIFPSHQWDYAGWTDNSVNLTNTQLFLVFLPGDGWSVGSQPKIFYAWEDQEWTVPLNLRISKTMKVGSMPLKLGLEVNYYVDSPDAFGPRWMVALDIAPVVENVLAGLFD